MHLKRLESVGFKSFAERIKVEFVPGVTAVVGPNGSGKSNITDAIRWVLGEQSIKSLRGSKMEDIIFQGSDTRKALNFAEVTLVLDNTSQKLPLDYSEVSVTRRVYRSGASEFYINKQTCRLKDIIDLFMDSGLGREAFSIISQGKVEEVLSSKAEERRIIFEEAAGVLKYKQRKKEAEYKLLETEENLNRIEDIVYEIDQQIKPLQKQAEIAEKHIKLNKELKKEEISLLVTEIEQLHMRWQTILNELKIEEEKNFDMKTNINQYESAVETDKISIQKLDDLIESLQANLVSITREVEHQEGKKRVMIERIKHITENKSKLETQKKSTKQNIQQLTVDLNEEENLLATQEKSRQKTNTDIQKIKSKLNVEVEEINDQIEEQRAEYIEQLNKQAVKRNELQSINEQLNKIKGIKHRQADKTKTLTAEKENLILKEQESKNDLQQREKTCQEQEQTIHNLKEFLHDKREQLDATQRNLSKGEQMIAQLKSRKDMLEEMKEDFQGFFHGVKSVLKAKKQGNLQHIHGAIIELINVPSDYILALETILGGQTQNIVVDNETAARTAINWLKQTNNGRATFLPLSSMKPRYMPVEMKAKCNTHQGFIGVAAELINTEPRYNNIIQYLMGNVVVAKTLKDANEIAVLLNRKYRIVTLEGDIVNPGGSMSGGAKKSNRQSLFTREQDIQDMSRQLRTYTRQAQTLRKRVEDYKQQIADTERTLNDSEQLLETNRSNFHEAIQKRHEIKNKLGTLDEQFIVFKQSEEQYNDDENSLKHDTLQITHTLKMINKQLQQIQNKVDELTEQQSNYASEKESLQQSLHDQQLQLAQQEERLRNQREKTKNLNKHLEESKQLYNRQETELAELLSIEQTEESALDIDQKINDKTKEKQDVTNHIQVKRSERLHLTKLMEDKNREIKQLNQQHQACLKKHQAKEVEANRLDVDLENKLSQLQTDYTITFEKASHTYGGTSDVETSRHTVNSLKQSLERLGTVNLGAIDEYKRLSDRYTFLTEQQTDLIEAKQTLFDVISEMDSVMKKHFSETFSQISKEFTIVFQSLFGGGKAELNLTDPKKILDTGIDIIAQPPGKRLQHLGLLSGGERALTAIALLFAILRVRPVPFCVLDEVEAALDEANVVRFAKYVKIHSEDTQFIVITHRKGTMEEADVLYGVTMKESGVSRLVSVRLEATDKLINA